MSFTLSNEGLSAVSIQINQTNSVNSVILHTFNISVVSEVLGFFEMVQGDLERTYIYICIYSLGRHFIEVQFKPQYIKAKFVFQHSVPHSI